MTHLNQPAFTVTLSFIGIMLVALHTSNAATLTAPAHNPAYSSNGNILVWNPNTSKSSGSLNINTQIDPAVPRLHGGNVIYVYLTNRNGIAINNAKVYARVTGKNRNRSLTLRDRGHGIYASDLIFPQPGKWHISIVANKNGAVKMISINLYVSPQS